MNDPERAFLVGIKFPDEDRSEALDSLKELEGLAESAGAIIERVDFCDLRDVTPATLIGRGKASDIALRAEGVDLIVFDAELSSVQQRNLEDIFGVKVLDRSGLILDIFARRARTREGKIQVELAQLQYMQTRLTGRGVVLSRLGGGIGTRGPGETKLEMDRRRIKKRIDKLSRELGKVRKTRQLHRRQRKDVAMPTVALVGYTNSGKSTLLNRLTDSTVETRNKLFATLDPTTRRLRLPDGQRILISDTVGFIRRLPHSLVEAFRATFEEAMSSELLVHVIDFSHPGWKAQAQVTDRVLREMNTEGKPVLRVYNKMDLVEGAREIMEQAEASGGVYVSALEGRGLDRLLWALAARLKENMCRVKIHLPVTEGELLNEIYNRGWVIRRVDAGANVDLEANVEMPLARKLEKRGYV